MLKRIIIVVIVFFQIKSFGQSSAALKKADYYFQKKSFYNASLNYEIYLGMREAPVVFSPYTNNKKKRLLEFDELRLNKPHSLKVFYNLAESYRMLNDPTNAEKWYRRVMLSRTASYPLALLWHGISLRALGDYDKAA